ncbi:hypothetical protein D1007_34709 [Hordeum vulgare]|nr:hypothetical protein D1007_34709 [Hordeum vulgare]
MEAGGGNGACLPCDVLLDILRRLAIARCRCVCRAWRAAIADAHEFLLPCYFPPRVFPGIFITKIGCRSDAAFFAPPRPATGGQCADDRPDFWSPIYRLNHGRGLCPSLVQRPSPLRALVWSPLHVQPGDGKVCSSAIPGGVELARAMFLAFDPAVSLHYEVFLFNKEDPIRQPPTRIDLEQLSQEEEEEVVEQPPTWTDLEQTCLPTLFAEEQLSEKEEEEEEEEEESVHGPGQWEKREFAPGSCAPGHLYDMVTASSPGYYEKVWSSEYWHGSLYVHCHNCVLLILEHLQQARFAPRLKNEFAARWLPGFARRAALAPTVAIKCSARASLQQRARRCSSVQNAM